MPPEQQTASVREPEGFQGTFDHSLDKKKRLTLPAQWREELGNIVYVMPDFHERCLQVLTVAQWRRLRDEVQGHPLHDRESREYARELGRQSQRVELDAQGRIRICDELMEFAGLVDLVRVQGTIDTIELWAPPAGEKGSMVDQAKLRAAIPKPKG